MRKIIICIIFSLLLVTQVQAVSTTFIWDANSASDNVLYYSLYCGSSPNTYIAPINVGNVTTWTQDMTGDFYCRLTATNQYGEGDMSNECSNTRPKIVGFSCSK